MVKWIYFIFFLILIVPSILWAFDDSGNSFADFIPEAISFIAFILAGFSFVEWRIAFKRLQTKFSLVIMFLPLIAMMIFVSGIFLTYQKINKAYNMFATLPGDHGYEYYFRDDSTLKIVGHFAMGDTYTFQKYRSHGDTILFDTIIPDTGIQSKK